MTARHDPAIERLFLDAIELPAPLQAEFVRRACGDDTPTAEAVLRLIEADAANSDGALDQSASSFEELAPVRLGSYRIVRTISQGGMGTVYEAIQDRPRRAVALKVIRAGLATEKVLRRFDAESEALAALRHPGVVQVFEAGVATATYSDGTKTVRPFLAMELVEGASIVEHAARRGLDCRKRLELIANVCEAVQHAHQQGIIHRDLKPANILVDRQGQPKVLDFGVARLAAAGKEHPTLTAAGQVIGTLAYMSPEQAQPDHATADSRSDVYSIGVVLFELLAGRTPAPGLDPRSNRTGERLASIDRALRGDISTIVETALAPEPDRRYQSAAELGADLRRFLRGEPIAARSPTGVYVLGRFIARNPVLVSCICIGLLGIIGGGLLATRAAVVANRQARQEAAANSQATAARKEAEAVVTFLTNMLSASDPGSLGKNITVREVLDRASESVGKEWAASPLVEAAVRHAIGRTYYGLGEYTKALFHLQAAFDIRLRNLGPSDASTLDTQSYLAAALNTLDCHDDARFLYTSLYEQNALSQGPSHPVSLSALAGIARTLTDTQAFPDAAALLSNCVSEIDRSNREINRSDMAIKGDYAWLLYRLGDTVKADELYREVLPAEQELLGRESPGAMQTLMGAAAVARTLGRTDEARAMYQEILAWREKYLGSEHPETLGSMNDLAILCATSGHLDEAEALYRRVLESAPRALGPAHRNTLKAQFNLSQAYVLNGKDDLAEPLLLDVLHRQQSVLGEHHVDVGDSLQTLASVYAHRKEFKKAADTFSQAISIFSSLLAPDNWFTAALRSERADCLVELGQYEDAARELIQARQVLGHSAAPSAASRDRTALQRLVRCYELWDKPDDAARCRAELDKLELKSTVPSH